MDPFIIIFPLFKFNLVFCIDGYIVQVQLTVAPSLKSTFLMEQRTLKDLNKC